MDLTYHKKKAQDFFLNKEYDKAYEIYNSLLLVNNDNNILLNKTLILLKLQKYQDCIDICSTCLKNDDENSIIWGRLGGALYGLGKYEDAKNAYIKAYSLKNLEIYNIMINKINNLNNDNSNYFNNIMNNIINNESMVNKLNDKNFQDKILKYQYNPLDMLNDNEMMGLMDNIMKNIKL